MKLKFKHQKFQADAATAVCDVFAGQPNTSLRYIADRGIIKAGALGSQETMDVDPTGYANGRITLPDVTVLENLQRVQRQYFLPVSPKLEGHFNLTIEMETGVGKTYTYIKTMFELNKRFGWTKFIVVVPSIAIREGVFKAFEITDDHFAEDYGKKIRYFIYNSSDLARIDAFASDSAINAMIINSQAFNARGKDARRISMKLDTFRSRRPIDVIAATNPVLVIDEPQSVEGKTTKEKLKEFRSILTLRYSATHRKDALYNLVYRLDALEAYNKRLVKKIAVKGISVSGTTATESYLYLERINVFPNKSPTATLEFECKGKTGVRTVSQNVTQGCNLYEHSGLEEYRGYTVSRIDGLKNVVEFTNGKCIHPGEVQGGCNEDQLRRIQIRETIQSHLEREQQLFDQGIKVLSLFFIDEVAKYRRYAEGGQQLNGEYADIFEQEYAQALKDWQQKLQGHPYGKYLAGFSEAQTHAGYFSIDKNHRMVNGKIKKGLSDDTDAYDLIMKDKERLLDRKEPVRFIFSHSALREGWDNPNVFQICTLKKSGSDVRKRQEVGRGLRLCVNGLGERMDTATLGEDVHHVNVLTVVANESYEQFTKQLQSEIVEELSHRPLKVTENLFQGKTLLDAEGLQKTRVDAPMARKIHNALIRANYLNDEDELTDKYFQDVQNGTLDVPQELVPFQAALVDILETVYSPEKMLPEDARSNNVELHVDSRKLQMREFQELWKRINKKSAYMVDFDTSELVHKAIAALDGKLQVAKIHVQVDHGEMEKINSVGSLANGKAFQKTHSTVKRVEAALNSGIKYDLVGKLVEGTGLTRKTIVDILQGIKPETFGQFQQNPEDFIIKSTRLIQEQVSTVIIEHITYNVLEEKYTTDLFTEKTLKGRLGVNAMQAKKHLYDYILYDSDNEKEFASHLDVLDEVAVYVKLPRGFAIRTPVGKYNPDWAIAFYEGKVKHIYFVAETKGSLSSMELRKVEELKINCAREHFRRISSDSVKYEVVDSYQALLGLVMR